MCIEHFTPDDYTISKDGRRFKLKPLAVPSVFDVILIEVNEEYDPESAEPLEHAINTTEIQTLRAGDSELIEEIERMKRNDRSKKLILNTRFKHLKAQQSKQIKSLRNQVMYLKKALTKAQRKIVDVTENDFISADIDVNVF